MPATFIFSFSKCCTGIGYRNIYSIPTWTNGSSKCISNCLLAFLSRWGGWESHKRGAALKRQQHIESMWRSVITVLPSCSCQTLQKHSHQLDCERYLSEQTWAIKTLGFSSLSYISIDLWHFCRIMKHVHVIYSFYRISFTKEHFQNTNRTIYWWLYGHSFIGSFFKLKNDETNLRLHCFPRNVVICGLWCTFSSM